MRGYAPLYRHARLLSPQPALSRRLFCFVSFYLFVMACAGGFAHGSNDVSNAIAPFVVIISIYRSEDVSQDVRKRAPLPLTAIFVSGEKGVVAEL
jgi:sodium-dependent phosphate transporter